MNIRFSDTETDQDTKVEVETSLDEKGHVYVHCTVPPSPEGMGVRIWRTTVLIDHSSAHESKLVYADGISYYPTWTLTEPGKAFSFLLIFEALPKTCSVFDLIERIPQSGGFEVRGIIRNEKDVYRVTI